MVDWTERVGEALRTAVESGSVSAYLFAFLFGVFISFTPCVYPVLPIIIGYVGNAARGSRWRAFFYSLAYVIGMAIVYTAIGVVISLLGGTLGRTAGNFWVLLVVGLLLVAVGLWTMGVFPVPAPQWLSRRASGRGHGRLVGAFIVGATSALVVGPCSTPGLAAILGVLAVSADRGAVGNIIYSTAVMFSYSLGIGLLMVVCGTFSGLLASLPKSGRWLNTVKVVFGLMVIGMGIYFLYQAVMRW